MENEITIYEVIESLKKEYEKAKKRHNGYIHHFHETTKDEKGNYIDSYLYEIINRRCFNAE